MAVATSGALRGSTKRATTRSSRSCPDATTREPETTSDVGPSFGQPDAGAGERLREIFEQGRGIESASAHAQRMTPATDRLTRQPHARAVQRGLHREGGVAVAGTERTIEPCGQITRDEGAPAGLLDDDGAVADDDPIDDDRRGRESGSAKTGERQCGRLREHEPGRDDVDTLQRQRRAT